MAENPKQPKAETRSGASWRDRRREPRFPISILIEVRGFDRDGQAFCERTMTLDASEWGVGFNLSLELEKDAIIAVRVADSAVHSPPDARPVMFQVMYSERDKHGWKMGAWKMDSERAWCVNLPNMAAPVEDCSGADKPMPPRDPRVT